MSEKTQRYQVGGNHYSRHKIQPCDIIGEYGLDFWAGNVIKYVLRKKPGIPRVEDLKKARHYLDHLIEREESRAATELLARRSLAAAREAIKTHIEDDRLEQQERRVRAAHNWAHLSEGQL